MIKTLLKSLFINGLGLAWLAFILVKYLETHTYYKNDVLGYWKEGLVLLGTWAIVLIVLRIGHLLLKKETVKLTVPRLIVGVLLAVTIVSSVGYNFWDPVVYRSDTWIVQFEGSPEFTEIHPQDTIDETTYVLTVPGDVGMYLEERIEQLPPEVQEHFFQLSWWEFEKNILIRVGGALLFLIVFSTLFYGVGALFIGWLWPVSKKQEPERVVATMGLGIGVLILILFGLGAFHVLTPLATKFVVLGLFLVSLPEGWGFLRKLFTGSIRLKWKDLGWAIIPLAVLIIVLSTNLLHAMRPQPMGWDENVAYLNFPHIMAESGELLSGEAISSLPGYMMITSLGFLLFDSTEAAILFTYLGALLAILGLFMVLRKVLKWQTAVLATALFATLPMTIFQMTIDLKMDLPLLFFALLSVLAAGRWGYGVKKEQSRSLILLGIFLGLAFSVKITAVLVIFVAFAFIGYKTWGWAGLACWSGLALVVLGAMGQLTTLSATPEWQGVFTGIGAMLLSGTVFHLVVQRRAVTWSALKPFLIVALTMGLVVGPFLLRNAIESQSLSVSSLLSGKDDRLHLDLASVGVDTAQCTGALDYSPDIVRYTGYGEGLQLLWQIPWYVTVQEHTASDSFYKDISFLFLGFLVLLILHWRSLDTGKFPKHIILALGLLYGFLWLVSASGITWYGTPGLVAALVLYGKLWEKHRWMILVPLLYILIIPAFQLSILRGNPGALMYNAGMMTYTEYSEGVLRGYELLQGYVNNDLNKDKNVYMIGSFMRYFVDRNYTRVFHESLMDTFDCLYLERDPELALQRLRDLNIGFILYNPNVIGNPSGVFLERMELFEEFATYNLEILMSNSEFNLYRIPLTHANP